MGIYMIKNNDEVTTYKTEYNIGDIIVFKSYNKSHYLIGMVEGFYVSTVDEEFYFHVLTLDGIKYEYAYAITEKNIIGRLDDDIAVKIKECFFNKRG